MGDASRRNAGRPCSMNPLHSVASPARRASAPSRGTSAWTDVARPRRKVRTWPQPRPEQGTPMTGRAERPEASGIFAEGAPLAAFDDGIVARTRQDRSLVRAEFCRKSAWINPEAFTSWHVTCLNDPAATMAQPSSHHFFRGGRSMRKLIGLLTLTLFTALSLLPVGAAKAQIAPVECKSMKCATTSCSSSTTPAPWP
jgi:hypothetical protein